MAYASVADSFQKAYAELALEEFVIQRGGVVYVDELKPLYKRCAWLKAAVGNLSRFCDCSSTLIYLPRTADDNARLQILELVPASQADGGDNWSHEPVMIQNSTETYHLVASGRPWA